MTYLEIYQIAKRLVPAELREKYDHLSSGEMPDVAELSQGRRARAVAAFRAHHHLLFRGDPGLFKQPYRAAI